MTDSSATVPEGIVQLRDIVTEADLAEAGISLSADFPDQRIEDLRKYPVLSEGGWFMVIKNQRTLESLSRRPWRLHGPIRLLSDQLDLG